MQLRLEFQENPVADEVSAITAVVRPVLLGLVHSLKADVLAEAGGLSGLKLFMLPRVRRPGDGDVGICFEYAVHDALNRLDPLIVERVADALTKCKVPSSSSPKSILFGAEKTGSAALIDTAKGVLTDDSVLLYGAAGRPLKLRDHIDTVAEAFRKPAVRETLPQSVRGLWKADLFVGEIASHKWVAATLKINKDHLEGASGLRLGIIPAHQGGSDAVYLDDTRNLVVCPLPYDRSFMQIFYEAWEVVVQFLAADARVPPERNLPRPPARQVARYLEDRREFPVLDVVEALAPLAQPSLLRTAQQTASLDATTETAAETAALLAPIPKKPG